MSEMKKGERGQEIQRECKKDGGRKRERGGKRDRET